jgi:hypothetical protein
VLAQAGLRSLEIGVESADRAMLSREKRKPPEHALIEAIVRDAQALGVRVICNYVLGLPDDDEETIRATVAWAKRLDSFAVQFTIATPYPGTTLEPRVHDLRLPVAPDAHTGFRPTFRHPHRPGGSRRSGWAYVAILPPALRVALRSPRRARALVDRSREERALVTKRTRSAGGQ